MRSRFAAAIVWRLAVVALTVAAASCAPVTPAPATGAAAAVGGAVVLTVRPIVAVPEDTGGWRAALLNGAGESGGPAAPGASLAEFIVRVDDGATLSIVQPNPDGLRVGERVVLARPSPASGSPRLARPL